MEPKPSEKFGWLWAAIVPITVLVYLLTSNIVLATLIPSIQAALPALRCGLWIRRFELRRGYPWRARVLYWFYVADALWLSAAAAFSTVLCLAFLSKRLGIQPNTAQIATAVLTIFIGAALTTILGLVVSVLAYRKSIRVWIHPRTRVWCLSNPDLLGQLRFEIPKANHAVFVLGTSLVVPVLAVGVFLLIAMIGNGQPINGFMNWASTAVMLVFFVFLPILSLAACAPIANRITANDPSHSELDWQNLQRRRLG